jgi:hypothetical protein
MILIIKLINGVEIIGSVVNQTKKEIEVDNPVQINYKNLEAAIPAVSLTRYLQFSKIKQCVFEKSKIMNITEPLDGFVAYYKTALNHFESEIDQTVNRELKRVSESEQDENETYMAVLERLSTNQMLN